MLFKNITILDENLDVQQNMYVGIKEDKIDYIGKETPDEVYSYIYDSEIYDGSGKLLMSGFYNTHSHSAMTLMRGYGENMSLQDWLNNRIFPFEAKLNGNAVYWGTLLAMAESIRYGIVSSTDMYDFVEDEVRAVIESGGKMNVGRGVLNFTGEAPKEMRSYKETEALIKEHNGRGMGRIITDVNIHGEYTSDGQTCKAMADLAKEMGTNMHIHLSETKLEHEECKVRHGKTPAKYMYDLGVFDTRTTAAHCVWLEEEDFELLAEKNVFVATCPASNLKLASGIANVGKMMSMGISVTLGTDSVSSNNSLNFIEDMKLLAIAAKVRGGNPMVLSPKEVINIATYAGAQSQGRKNCGKIKVGNKADLIVLDTNKPHMCPVHDLVTNIVYSASGSDVVLTMADGKVLYRDGEYKTIDIEKTMFEATKATNKILGEL